MGHHHRRPSKRRRVSFRTPDEASMVLPLQIAMNRAALLLPHEQEEVFKPTREAFEQFRLGHGNEARCAQLVDAMKISAELACRQIASDHKRTFAEALEVLADVINRHARTASHGYHPHHRHRPRLLWRLLQPQDGLRPLPPDRADQLLQHHLHLQQHRAGHAAVCRAPRARESEGARMSTVQLFPIKGYELRIEGQEPIRFLEVESW